MDTPSALPSVMQNKLAQMRTDAGTAPPAAELPPAPPAATPPAAELPPAPPAATPPAATPPATPPAPTDGERVTISREEFNRLRADADKTATVTGQEEMLRLALEEAQERLTQLDAQVKSSSTAPPAAPASSAPLIDTSGIQITEEENTRFGESEAYVTKIVDKRIADILNKHLPQLQEAINQAKELASGAATSVAQNNSKSFQAQLLDKVPNLSVLIKHKHWGDFLQAREDFTGATFGQLLGHNIEKGNLESLVKIYKTFEEKYITPISTKEQDAYAGVDPTGHASQLPPEEGKKEKLKFSARKKASEDYKFKRITWDQLQEVNKAFDEAAKTDNIDYNA